MANSISTETKTLRRAGKGVAAALATLALAGCISPTAGSDGRYANPIGGAPVIDNETPYSPALRCLARQVRGQGLAGPRIAVGAIADYTGKEEYEGGRKVTQGAALMAISALAKSGVRLVERYDTGVTELELKYANNKLIGDEGKETPYRQIHAGMIPGSDFYLVGGITELNFNIRSGGIDGTVQGESSTSTVGTLTASQYVLNVGLDLRLVKTGSLEVVDVISYQKQIIGREISAGVFDFLGGSIIDVGLGEKALEPIQLAVRSVIERAVLEMVGSLYGVGPQACTGGNDPLKNDTATAYQAPRKTNTYNTAHAQAAYTPAPAPAAPAAAAYSNGGYTNETRSQPYGWYADSDGNIDTGLRGSL